MKIAEDFRRIARNSLAGKWWLAVASGLVVSLLGGINGEGPQIEFNVGSGEGLAFTFAGREFVLNPNLISFIAGTAIILVLVALVFAAAYFIIGSFVGVGYAQFNLDLVDGKNADFGTLFSHYSSWASSSASRLLRILYVFLWSLLFVIPGIIASYSYAMTDYILAETPGISASNAIAKSKAMMSGNKWRLFCLHFSFIGWDILAFLTFGIGYLWLTPYKQAAIAAFYRDVYAIEGGKAYDEPPIHTTFEEAPSDNNTQE